MKKLITIVLMSACASSLFADNKKVENAVPRALDFTCFTEKLNGARAEGTAEVSGTKGGTRGREKGGKTSSWKNPMVINNQDDSQVSVNQYVISVDEYNILTNAIADLMAYAARDWTIIHSSETSMAKFHGGFDHAEILTNEVEKTIYKKNYYKDGYIHDVAPSPLRPRPRYTPGMLKYKNNLQKLKSEIETLEEVQKTNNNRRVQVSLKAKRNMYRRLVNETSTNIVNVSVSPGKKPVVTGTETRSAVLEETK